MSRESSGKARACIWNGKRYGTLAQAARDIGIDEQA